jgi:prophage antirepressor-like protein
MENVEMPQVRKRKRTTGAARWNKYVELMTRNGYASRDSARKSWKRLMEADKKEGLRLLNYHYPTLSLQANKQQTVLNFDDAKDPAESTEDDHIEIEAQLFTLDPGVTVRVVDYDGEEWFIANDICKAIGVANTRDALSRLDSDEKRTVPVGSTDTNRLVRNVNVVSRSGVYEIIMTSRKPEAKRFRRWVTDTVIPTLEKGKWVRVTPPKEPQPAAEPEAPKAVASEIPVSYTLEYTVTGDTRKIVATDPKDRQWLLQRIQRDSFITKAETPVEIVREVDTYSSRDEAEIAMLEVRTDAPEHHYPAATLLKRFIDPGCRQGYIKQGALLSLSKRMQAVYEETYGGPPPHYKPDQLTIKSGSSVYTATLYYYDIRSVWGVFLVGLYRSRYKSKNEYFKGMLLRGTPEGYDAHKKYHEYARTDAAHGFPQKRIPSEYVDVVTELTNKNWVLS